MTKIKLFIIPLLLYSGNITHCFSLNFEKRIISSFNIDGVYDFSVGDSVVAMATNDGKVYFYSFPNKLERIIECNIHEMGQVKKMSFTFENKLLLLSENEKNVYIVSVDTVMHRSVEKVESFYELLDPIYQSYFESVAYVPHLKYNDFMKKKQNIVSDYECRFYLSPDSVIYSYDYPHLLTRNYDMSGICDNTKYMWISDQLFYDSKILAFYDEEILVYFNYCFLITEDLKKHEMNKITFDCCECVYFSNDKYGNIYMLQREHNKYFLYLIYR
ncbi:MAG: hypothetical protein VZQ98_14985 [Bacteroidales bacterium]|nr:hypothetical protein [Bacteroidales bacterium]